MEIIKKRSVLVTPQKYNKDIKYKVAKYTFVRQCRDYKIAFSTLSNCCVIYKKDEEKELKQFLVENCFLIPANLDDFEVAKRIKDSMSDAILSNSKLDTGHSRYVIYTTTDCNARCYYCFEGPEDIVRDYMSPKVANDTADFIIKNFSGNEQLSINWYGGEPLLNQEPINIISQKLHESNIEFRTGIITNGTLIDSSKIDIYKNFWNVNNFQIAIDGTDEEYRKAKRFIDDSLENLEKLLDDIECLLKNNIEVTVRLNIGLHNESELSSLIDIFADRFKKYSSLFIVQLAPIYQLLASRPFEINEINDRLTKHYNKKFEKRVTNIGLPIVKNIKCTVDQNITLGIKANGEVVPCTRPQKKHEVGSIYNDPSDWNKDLYNQLKERKTCDLCKDCLGYLCCNLPNICGSDINCNEDKLEFFKIDTEKRLDRIINSYIYKNDECIVLHQQQ
jgi:sulfatase maturation enzyme AslB (radical SAM superfamily)